MNKSILYLFFIALLTSSCWKYTSMQDVIPNHDNFTINSSFVNETRVINVWLPPNDKNSTNIHV